MLSSKSNKMIFIKKKIQDIESYKTYSYNYNFKGIEFVKSKHLGYRYWLQK